MDGLVWTIFGGRNPKVGVNHVKLVVSLYYYVVLIYFFCLHDDDDYECSIMPLWWMRSLNMFFLLTPNPKNS